MKWDELEGKHAGEVGLVIGNGPSLREVPLAFLKSFPSFGTNKIYLLEGFTPTYYCAVNPLVIDQSVKQIESMNSRAKFIRSGKAIKGALALGPDVGGFSKNPARSIGEGFTVTYVCLQLAYFMGFQTVLLVGVDHNFTYSGQPNQENTLIGKDVNHFDPNYFSGQRWNNPDLKNSELFYQVAKQVYENAGRRIINLTHGTKLDVFEKQDIAAWM